MVRQVQSAECRVQNEDRKTFLRSALCVLRSAFLSGRTIPAVLAFLLMFAIVLVLVSDMYLLPAMSAAKDANPAEKARLAAYSRLLLAVVLFVLFVGLLLTFRIGRFFFPKPQSPPVKTKYIDAWTEAGKRLDMEKKEE